jgi:hypothetical protein
MGETANRLPNIHSLLEGRKQEIAIVTVFILQMTKS